jgi:hypothetical protein
MRTVTSVTTPSRPSEPGEQAEQIVSLAVEMLAADAQDFAGDQHQLEAEHVVGGQAVFQAVHAAGILRHVAANRAGDLRGRVGGVVETVGLDRVGDAEVGHAGLGDDAAVVIVDLEDPVELGEPQQHPVGERQRAPRQRRAAAARHHRHARLVAILQDPADLLGGFRQHHDQRHLAIGGEPVALVGAQLLVGIDHALAGHDVAQARNDLGAPLEHVTVRRGHLHAKASSWR